MIEKKETGNFGVSLHNAGSAAYGAGKEIDVRELIDTIWRGKGLVSAIVLAGSIFALIFVLNQPNIYRSEALLSPADLGGQQAGSRLAREYGGLASLAGIDLGSDGVNETQIALAVLESRSFLIAFIRRHDLLVPLMAAKGWDHESGGWIIDENVYDLNGRMWVRNVKPPKTKRPTELEAYRELKKRIMVAVDQDKGFVTVSLELMSPEATQEWLNKLIFDLNDHMRQREILEAERTVSYLQAQIGQTSIAEMQKVFYELIVSQTQRLMLAKVGTEYAFRVIDPPVIPEEKTSPKRLRIMFLAAFLSGMLGVFGLFIRNGIRAWER